MDSNSTRSRNGSSQDSSTRDQRQSTHAPYPYYIDSPSQGQPLPYYPHPDYAPVEQDFSHYGYRALPTYDPSQARRSTAGPPNANGSTTAHTDYYATQGVFTDTSSQSSSHSGHVHQAATTPGVALRGTNRSSQIAYTPDAQFGGEGHASEYTDTSTGQRGRSTRHYSDCGICLEALKQEDVVEVEVCLHTFCRDCLRTYIETKVQDRKYPIVCPQCAMSEEERGYTTVLSNFFVRDLGVTDNVFEGFVELELSPFAVQSECPTCRNSFYAEREPREGADDTNIVRCPLPLCIGVWCRNCNKSVYGDSEVHICDGTVELDNLMRRRGWKYCPGCRTATSKSKGCNHMKCPACNMHFCYACGEAITQSQGGFEIYEALERHYEICRAT